MTNAELIIKMQEEYDNTRKESILDILNMSIIINRSNIKELNESLFISNVTGVSEYSVISWLNGSKKIPLIYLCILSKRLNNNIFSYFLSGKNKYITKKEFICNDNKCKSLYPTDSADIYINVFNLQRDTDKNIVIDNIEKYYGDTKNILKHHTGKRKNGIMEICGCSAHTYYSWFNRSRNNVKIPILSLCKLAKVATIDLFDLFK